MKRTLIPSAYDFLTDQQKKLVDAYLDPQNFFDQKTALALAGYSPYANTRSASNPFKTIAVKRAISEKLKPEFSREKITFEENFKFVSAIAYGDPSELVEIKRVNCRWCNGVNHEYQWTHAEYKAELDVKAEAFRKSKDVPSSVSIDELEDLGFKQPECSGGFGFDKWLDPVIDCPECAGHGVASMYVHPQFLSHPLYAGAEVDKNGHLKINMRNQDNALKLLAQLAGFLVEKVEIKEVVTANHLAERRKKADERKAMRDAKKKD